MHPSIISILARLRQDVGEILKPETIRDACLQAGYSWRNRKLDPVATVSLFLLQILHGNTACQRVVQFGEWAFTATAYCKARKRLPLAVVQVLVEMVGETEGDILIARRPLGVLGRLKGTCRTSNDQTFNRLSEFEPVPIWTQPLQNPDPGPVARRLACAPRGC